MEKLNYISILAGGSCPMNCHFCIGKETRKESKPRFATVAEIEKFLKENRHRTDTLSISGVNSDPLAVSNIKEVVALGKEYGYRMSLHTCYHKKLIEMDNHNEKWFGNFYRIVISINEMPSKAIKSFVAKYYDKVRASFVYNSKNRDLIDRGDYFKSVASPSYIIRLNVFEDIRPTELEGYVSKKYIHKQPLYDMGDFDVVVWDYKTANQEVKAEYLFPDGTVRNQMDWFKLWGGVKSDCFFCDEYKLIEKTIVFCFDGLDEKLPCCKECLNPKKIEAHDHDVGKCPL